MVENNLIEKFRRFGESFLFVERGRKGHCDFRKCKAACCRLPFRCPFLKKDLSCAIYKIRPLNCRKFPRTRRDWALVKERCSFRFNN